MMIIFRKRITTPISSLLLFFLLFTSASLCSQTTIWGETFTYANGVTSGTSTGIALSSWTSTNGVNIRSNTIESNTSSASGSWRTGVINSVGFTAINVSFSTSINSVETSDRFSFRYRLDGGAWVVLVAPVL